MQNLDIIAEELFSKIRGRFPGVTIGDDQGNVTQEPKTARFFEFPFRENQDEIGKVSISLSEEDGVVVMHNKEIAENSVSKSIWYDFLKELRQFSKKRLLNFTTRDITKSNLEKRDYKYLAQRSGDSNMTESKLYGTSRISYQDVGEARLVIKHNESIDQTSPTGRNRSIGKIYVESPQGERFLYPYKHLSGARAMARHVAEGGNAYDDFGKHITGLSEELAKLKKFKNYMGRSSVMAESLSEYMDVVKERVATVKKTIEGLQKPNYYKEAFESFESSVLEEVPNDVAENWVEQLTIRQFNEELKDVFPYIYKLVSEATKAKAIGPDDLSEKSQFDIYKNSIVIYDPKTMKVERTYPMNQGKRASADAEKMDMVATDGAKYMELVRDKKRMSTQDTEKVAKLPSAEEELERGFEELMGQFAEGAGEYSYTLEYNGEENGYAKHKLTITSPEGKTKVVADDFTYFDTEDPEELQAELESWFNKGHGVGDEGMDEGFDPEEFEGEFDYEGVGDDGETTPCVVSYTAKVDDMGRPVVDPKSISIDCQQDGNSKLGFDADMDLEMQDMKELLQMAQEDADEMWDSRDNKYAHGEGNAYANAVRQAKKDGKKKGDKIQGPDGDEITLEKDKKTPLGEFILSYFDRETGEFPKGETAVLTMIEKDYGEEFIEPAKQFIERINQTFEEYQMAAHPQQLEPTHEFDRMRELAGIR